MIIFLDPELYPFFLFIFYRIAVLEGPGKMSMQYALIPEVGTILQDIYFFRYCDEYTYYEKRKRYAIGTLIRIQDDYSAMQNCWHRGCSDNKLYSHTTVHPSM